MLNYNQRTYRLKKIAASFGKANLNEWEVFRKGSFSTLAYIIFNKKGDTKRLVQFIIYPSSIDFSDCVHPKGFISRQTSHDSIMTLLDIDWMDKPFKEWLLLNLDLFSI